MTWYKFKKMNLYESHINKIDITGEYDLYIEKKRLSELEKKEEKFIKKLGYISIAKCIEREFNESYQNFKKELSK